MKQNEVFHVHSYRCKHAAHISDEEYIKTVISMGATEITFTDHAPFPGDPFGSRMKYKELDSYIEEIKRLREKYKEQIVVRIGLEIEYLPSYRKYYKELNQKLDLLMLGQHFFESKDGTYSFTFDSDHKKKEAVELGQAIVEGIHTNLFSVVAHPDRIFKRNKEWTPQMTQISKKIIEAAVENQVILEQNLASIRRKQYWNEFWNLVPKEAQCIIGVDAHSLKDLAYMKSFLN